MLKNVVVMLVGLPFLLLTLKALLEFGYVGTLQQGMQNSATQQITLDLIIAGGFGVGWMWHDAKRKGLSFWPFVVLVVPLGSVGFLAYFAYQAYATREPAPLAG